MKSKSLSKRAIKFDCREEETAYISKRFDIYNRPRHLDGCPFPRRLLVRERRAYR